MSSSVSHESKRFAPTEWAPLDPASNPFSSHAADDDALADQTAAINRMIAAIDAALSRQISAIIHHERFRRLEASWRQLHMLVSQSTRDPNVHIRVCAVTWKELARDIDKSAEFDQSHLFELIYSREFDMAGGEPFGLLVGDFEVCAGINPQAGTDDIATLEGITATAAAAFAPFVCGAAPSLLDVEKFAELDRQTDMAFLRETDANRALNRLRRQPDARFLGICVPRVLVRAPWRFNDPYRQDGFCFREDVAPDGSSLCYGNAAFAFAMVALREYMDSGWFADIRGVPENGYSSGGGLADFYPPMIFPTDRSGMAAQPPVEIRFTPAQEQMLAEYGLIPLMTLPYSTDLVFNTNQSMHAVERYSTAIARQNARISAMLQYVLCASRFAHYLKFIMRESVGQVADGPRLEAMLNNWLSRYCIGNDDAESDMKARFPLRTASIRVREVPGKPGTFTCVMQLQPHFQLDDVTANFQLAADMNTTQGDGS